MVKIQSSVRIKVQYPKLTIDFLNILLLNSTVLFYFRYSDLLPTEPVGSEASARSRLVTSSLMSSDMYNEIRELYITAAQRAPVNDIDSNIQASNLGDPAARIGNKGKV